MKKSVLNKVAEKIVKAFTGEYTEVKVYGTTYSCEYTAEGAVLVSDPYLDLMGNNLGSFDFCKKVERGCQKARQGCIYRPNIKTDIRFCFVHSKRLLTNQNLMSNKE